MTKAIIIPPAGPIQYLDEFDDSLDALQGVVKGSIEAVPIPWQFGGEKATAYVNEEGKYVGSWEDSEGDTHEGMTPNLRATNFMVPGYGLFFGDYIAGPFLILGFDPYTGEHTDSLDERIVQRVKTIANEA